MKYRKQPELVDAIQWTGSNLDDVTVFCGALVSSGGFGFTDRQNGQVVMNTAAGTQRAEPGDWVVKGVDGSFKAVKPEAFAAIYEIAE